MSLLDNVRARLAGEAPKTAKMRQTNARIIPLTVAELVAACEASVNKSLAMEKLASVARYPNGSKRIVYCEAIDIEALMDGKTIEVYEEYDATIGRTLVKKRLVPLNQPLSPPLSPSIVDDED